MRAPRTRKDCERIQRAQQNPNSDGKRWQCSCSSRAPVALIEAVGADALGFPARTSDEATEVDKRHWLVVAVPGWFDFDTLPAEHAQTLVRLRPGITIQCVEEPA